MKLTLEINLDDEFASLVADKLGMIMTKESVSEDSDGAPMVDEVPVTSDDVDKWLENHMKSTMTNIYAKVIEDIKLAELDTMRKQQEAVIMGEIDSAIKVGIVHSK